jgi:predicted Zn-dependent protease
VALLEAWSRKVPRDLVAQRALADMQMFAGQMDAARKGYAALVQAQPNDAGLLLAQARMLARMGDPAALGAAERAFKLAPGQTAVADTYGWLLLRSGNTEASVRVLREARLRDPANGVLRWHLAAALAKAGRRGEAVEELRAALEAKPPVPADPELDKLRKDLGL